MNIKYFHKWSFRLAAEHRDVFGAELQVLVCSVCQCNGRSPTWRPQRNSPAWKARKFHPGSFDLDLGQRLLSKFSMKKSRPDRWRCGSDEQDIHNYGIKYWMGGGRCVCVESHKWLLILVFNLSERVRGIERFCVKVKPSRSTPHWLLLVLVLAPLPTELSPLSPLTLSSLSFSASFSHTFSIPLLLHSLPLGAAADWLPPSTSCWGFLPLTSFFFVVLKGVVHHP